MPLNSVSDVTSNAPSGLPLGKARTAIDNIAESYWQDFIASRPIADGIAYEAQLHDCQLDESLASLQRVDLLLTQISRDHIKASTLDEGKLLADDHYRHLLLFLAFYAGRVLARHLPSAANLAWYGQSELSKYYPELPIIANDFYHQMAFSYDNPSKEKVATQLFFALEPIGMRLFGSVDRKFTALQGGQVASGLYQAVNKRLSAKSDSGFMTHDGDVSHVNAKAAYENKTIEPSIVNSTINNIANLSAINSDKTQKEKTKASAVPKIALSKPKVVSPTPEIFTQLLIELEEIAVAQDKGDTDYQQACKTLDQFERYIARQTKPRAQVAFSEQHQEAREHALIMLEQAASAGHTGAMLRLAMYELLGESPSVNHKIDDKVKEVTEESLGVDWVKKAANNKDSRAQRLLSKMYYQGIGVEQNIERGKFWLEQAAKNGHAEAAEVVAQWQKAELLMTTKQEAQHSSKRYQWLVAAIAVAALLLLILV